MNAQQAATAKAMADTLLYQGLALGRLMAMQTEALLAGDAVLAQAATMAMLRMP